MNSQYPALEGLEEASRRKAELESDEGGPLRQLATVMLPIMFKEATILISSPPCEDCTRLKQILNRILGLNISLLDHSKREDPDDQNHLFSGQPSTLTQILYCHLCVLLTTSELWRMHFDHTPRTAKQH